MPCCGSVYDKQICLQALSRAMDLRPLHNQIGQELQEAKAHLTLEQINEVITTPVQPTLPHCKAECCVSAASVAFSHTTQHRFHRMVHAHWSQA